MNALANETSPYLLQHADNPVAWYPWGPEALERARSENKPILLSVGYSACHWCHVMAHESFEDEATAALMNEHLVNIEVDREARPDLGSAARRGARWHRHPDPDPARGRAAVLLPYGNPRISSMLTTILPPCASTKI